MRCVWRCQRMSYKISETQPSARFSLALPAELSAISWAFSFVTVFGCWAENSAAANQRAGDPEVACLARAFQLGSRCHGNCESRRQQNPDSWPGFAPQQDVASRQDFVIS